MEKYYLSPKKIYFILKEKGVENLYHANTVLTSKTFIRERALLSREYVESNSLIQTEQKSDSKDKEFNVWNDVFLDGLDLHDRYSRANYYGPVLFILDLELLLSPSLPKILVTRKNPISWRSDCSWDECYYSNHEEIVADYLTGKVLDSQVMFTFRSPDKFLKLNKFLKAIVIDRPQVIVRLRKCNCEGNIGDAVLEDITEVLRENGLSHIPVGFRHEGKTLPFCTCTTKYTSMYNLNSTEFRKKFGMQF